MFTFFHDFAVFHDDDFIGFFDGGKSVCNDDGSSVFGDFFCCSLNQFLTFVVDGRSRFVENQNFRVRKISS